MFVTKILVRNIFPSVIQHESRHTGTFRNFSQKSNTSSVGLSTSIREPDEQDSTKNQPSLLSMSTSTPDKLYKKIEVEVRGNDPAVLKSYGEFVAMAANHLKINVGRNTAPYKATHERWTVLKSAHVHKKHRVQYEIRTYYRYLDFLKLTGSTADTFLEYIQRNLPEGVAMKVTKMELEKFPESIAAMCNNM